MSKNNLSIVKISIPPTSPAHQHITGASSIHDQGSAYRVYDQLVPDPDSVDKMIGGMRGTIYSTKFGKHRLFVGGSKKKAVSALLVSLLNLSKKKKIEFVVDNNKGWKQKYGGSKNGREYNIEVL